MPDKTADVLGSLALFTSLEKESSSIRQTTPPPPAPCMAIVIVTPVLGFLWYSTASTLSLLVDVQTSSRMQPTSPLSTGTPFLDPGRDCSLSKTRDGGVSSQGCGLRCNVERGCSSFLDSRTEAGALSLPNGTGLFS